MEERIVVADPVAQPMEYQRELLALLGGRDPVEVMAETPVGIRNLAFGLSDEVMTTRPEPREWSAAEVLGHIWDAELVVSFRGRSILGQDEPSLMGYDQDAWALLPRPPFPVMVDAFEAIRAANLHLARSIPAADSGTGGGALGARAVVVPAAAPGDRRARHRARAPVRADACDGPQVVAAKCSTLSVSPATISIAAGGTTVSGRA